MVGENKSTLRDSSARERGVQWGLCGWGENRPWARTQGNLAADESVGAGLGMGDSTLLAPGTAKGVASEAF